MIPLNKDGFQTIKIPEDNEAKIATICVFFIHYQLKIKGQKHYLVNIWYDAFVLSLFICYFPFFLFG